MGKKFESHTGALIADAVLLWTRYVIHNKNTIRRLRNLANRKIPDLLVTQEINTLVESLKSDDVHS